MSHERYRTHSDVTFPGVSKDRIGDLPENVADLIEVVAGLLIHFETDAQLLDRNVVEGRKVEIDSRYVSTIVSRILRLDDAPLSVARPPEKRLLSTCRDSAVLLCALLRNTGIPARVRYGFSHVFYEPRQVIHDHVVVEYWTGEDWRIADSRLSRAFRRRHDLAHLNPVGISPDLFIPGGDAWRRVRTSQVPARAFSDLRGDDGYGLWKVRNLMIYDLTSLCGFEPLLWDAWGVMLLQPPGVPPHAIEQLEFLDEMAECATISSEECAALIARFSMAKGIYPENQIISFSPVSGRHTVDLKRRDLA